MATKANLLIDQGTTFNTVIALTDENGDTFDLTTYTGRAEIRKHYTSTNAVSFGVTLGGNTGTVTLSLTANQTSNMSAGRFVYDVELNDSSNNVVRVLEGIVTVTPEVTR
mgnify:CR=1 FL=1|jgi:hypothetical protein